MYTAQDLYGGGLPTATAAPTHHMATDGIPGGIRGLLNPHNPLLWFGVILAVTLGAGGVAGSVRLGKAKITGQVGEA